MILGGNLGILAATLSFAMGMMMLGNPKKAARGNALLVIGMICALFSTILIQTNSNLSIPWVNISIILGILFIGVIIGKKVSFGFELTKMPELVSLFNGFGGAAAGLIGLVGILETNASLELSNLIILSSSIFLGFMTFTASCVAFLKLGGKYNLRIANNKIYTTISLLICIGLILQTILFPTNSFFTLALLGLILFSLLNGIFFASAIGGGDMPILISVLNGFTGVLTVIAGIYFESTIMILAGVFVAATGIILTVQMCSAMNTSLKKVFLGSNVAIGNAEDSRSYEEIQTTTPAKVAADLILVKKVVIVPGFGLAVAKAQKLCRELMEQLAEADIELKFVIHPVAGRMPGHMNVLLAEAGIEYEHILDLTKGNEYLSETDLCLVIGANDVVNTSAENDAHSIIHGMPIIQTYKAKKVVVVKRSLSPGYAGIKNPLFENKNSELLLIDAKEALDKVITELKM